MTRAQRRKAKRERVQREERVKPPPEAEQHRRPWPMQELLALGPRHGGLDHDEFEAGVELVETFRLLVADRDMKHSAFQRLDAQRMPMSEHAATMTKVWFAWSAEVGPVATHLVDQIEDTMPIRSVDVLRHGLRRWLKLKADVLQGIDTTPPAVTLTIPVTWSYGATVTNAIPIPGPPPSLPQAPSRSGTPAQAALRSVTSRR